MSALMIARITVKDPDKFQDYLTRSKQIASQYGAELLHRGTVSRVLNGDDDHALVVIARFSSHHFSKYCGRHGGELDDRAGKARSAMRHIGQAA